MLHCTILLPKQGAYAVKYNVFICVYIYVCVCVTLQNLKLSLSGTDVGVSRAANNGHVSSTRDNAVPSPITPLHARLRAAVQKPVQVGYHVAVQ